jgi:hypothetical protein
MSIALLLLQGLYSHRLIPLFETIERKDAVSEHFWRQFPSVYRVVMPALALVDKVFRQTYTAPTHIHDNENGTSPVPSGHRYLSIRCSTEDAHRRKYSRSAGSS